MILDGIYLPKLIFPGFSIDDQRRLQSTVDFLARFNFVQQRTEHKLEYEGEVLV